MKFDFINQTVYGIIFLIIFSLSSINPSAQNINFNYATSGLSTTDCNIFDPPLTVQGYTHTAFASHPKFVNSSIYVPAIYQPAYNTSAGTGYAISYPFTANHTYAIGLNVNANIDNSAAPLPYLKVGLSSSLPTKTIPTSCDAWPIGFNNPPYLSFPSIYNKILSTTNNIQIPAFIGSGQPYLLISTYPYSTVSPYVANVYINSISISDVPPITPSSASLQCSGSSQVFSVNTPYQVSWAVSPTGILTLTPGSNAQSVTATATTNTGYIVTLTANVNTPNGIVTLNRQVAVGVPVTNISSSAGACNNGYQTWTLSATSPSIVTSWQWTKDASATGSWYIYNPSSPNTMVDVSGGGGGISLTTTNACGTGKNGVTIYANCPHAITATPNPTTGNVTIAIAEQKGITSANEKKAMMYQIKVTDQFSAIKKLYKYSSGTSNSSISLHGLIAGTYTIQAFDGTSWSSVQVIKQ